jgi:membrane-associated protein
MDFFVNIIDIFLHLDTHLMVITQTYGAWTYGILFLIVFCETGLVVTPFLPGDSLLFATGTLAALGAFHPALIIILLITAAVLGNTTNYFVGYKIGARLLANENSRIFKKSYIAKTHEFYEKYGGKTIMMAQFVPIVRTFAPFMAGVGKMSYFHFAAYNVSGAIVWVTVCTLAGYFFGNIPFVRNNFSVVVLAIITISLLPAIIEYIKHRRAKSAK